MEVERNGMVSILKESRKMRHAKKRDSKKGFTLIETMIALVVLGVGILGLGAMLADSLAYMQGSQDDFIAQQKAEEAAEAIFTAKYSNNATFAQISNFGVTNPSGLFLTGPQPLLVPGPDGLVGSVNDGGAPVAAIVTPGPDGKLGTADDVQLPLSNFTRTITITDVTGKPNLRQVVIRIDYQAGRFQRNYSLTTYVSSF
jgi:prepilin-type N-terminal cleavage/methylation domain-containing protein